MYNEGTVWVIADGFIWLRIGLKWWALVNMVMYLEVL